jgi:hypothetical protein
VADGELPLGFAEKKTAMVGRGEMEKGAPSRAASSGQRRRVGWWKGLPIWAKAVAVLGLAAAAVAFFAAAVLVGLSSAR